MPRILVCGWAGAGNVGDELLTRSAVRLIRGAGGEPVIVSRDPRATEATHGVETARWGVVSHGTLAGIDGVCVGPGGIIQDSSSVWSLPGHLLSAVRMQRRRGAVAGIGLGVEPLRRRSSAALVRRALSGSSVLCRDGASADALASVGVAASVAADLAFTLDVSVDAEHDELAVAIGPEVRSGRLTPAARRLVAPDLDLVARGLDAQAARLDASVALLCFRGDRDRMMAEALADRLAAPSSVVGGDVDEQVARVAGARVLVTSRYHALAVAAMAGTPTVVVSTQAKLASLAEQVEDVVVARRSGWDDLAELVVDGERRSPVIPPIGSTRAVVADLVRAAGAVRDSASLG